MKITNFTFSDNSLVVYFDVEFKQINYVKMESQSNDSHGTLECEEMEIKYSKKNSIHFRLKRNSRLSRNPQN